ncbi:class I SAM-dependent methyltransferase [Pedobacter gandavensis]|uniref:Methyltransferase domain-containing protein n=1 Tax=Pedobacter gandavensis TaxID=2679963 RepID=A0ABR6ERH6_9SPHI|nr:class I SAM-dependent methyltransferase [Pedobacter gandavensis]MBB2147434.1 methyltransferase domain-containing protein [Pedobacter gandavensis]
MTERKSHWDNVYASKQPEEVSWTQDIPQTSLDFINSFNLPKTANIIDIGGGDSKLVDYLLDQGYQNVTVLDISGIALEKARKRLGERGDKVKWIVSDITEFSPSEKYDVWHDRATFHFLVSPEQIQSYLRIARESVNGHLIIGVFSKNGPEKCSGLVIRQYSEADLDLQLSNGFQKLRCITEDHTTPFNTIQNFLFCSFKRLLTS